MSNRFYATQLKVADKVNDEDAQLDLADAPGEDRYVYIEKLNFSVYEVATDSGGKFRIQDTLGNEVYTVDANSTKDISLDFGEEGYRCALGAGLQAIVYGADVSNASVSVVFIGHLDYR